MQGHGFRTLFGSVALAVCSAFSLSACGGAEMPVDDVARAKAAISAAETAGAANIPQAALHLKMARDQVSKAEGLIQEDENEDGQLVLMRATADAELALSLARKASLEAEADAAAKEIEKLKED